MRTHTFRGSLLAVAAVLLAVVGCDEVEERVIWSPDGSRAVVRVGDELHLLDPNGNLSGAVTSNVVSATWLPDSRGLVLLRSLEVAHWADAVQLLPPEETATVESMTKALPDLLRAGLAFANGNVSNMDNGFFAELEMKHPEFFSPTILCLLDTQPAALDQALQAADDPKKLKEDLSNARTTTVSEVSVMLLGSNTSANTPRVIERTLTELQQPRTSPSGGAVAFIRRGSLMVAPLDGATNRVVVAEKVEGGYDWTPDGKALVYAVRFTEQWASGAINLVRIERRGVVGPSGELMASDPQPLAISSSSFEPRVRCLRNGRVLFAGLDQHLPAPATGAQESRFYLIDPALATNAVPVTVPSATGALPQDLAAFAPSPDGRQIAIVESGSDAVALLDVATGALEVVSPKHGWKSTTLPAWRGTNEFYFAALPEATSPRPELLRWRKGSIPQVVSKGWPAEANSILLKKSDK